MSRTFELGCDQCNVCLWIGQGKHPVGPEMFVYSDNEQVMARLAEFIQEHLGHPLRVLETNQAADTDWREIDRATGLAGATS